MYNADYKVVQFCDGTNWIAMTCAVASSCPGGGGLVFTNQTGVALNATITSNTITSSAAGTATCGAGCTAISINGAAFVAGPVLGVNVGDTIAIRQTSSASTSTTTTATVSVGATASAAWSVTTTNLPPGSWTDALTDETKVDTVQNISATYSSAGGGYYRNSTTTVNDYVPTMTSDTTPSGICTASSTYSAAYSIWGAFDDLNSTNWHSGVQGNGSWIGYEFTASKAVNRWRVQEAYLGGTMTYGLEGWNGSAWVRVDTQTYTFPAYAFGPEWTNSNTTAYIKYRVIGDSVGGDGWMRLQEVEFGNITSANMTVVSKNVASAAVPMPTGDLTLQVKDVSGTATVNTDFKGYISRDNGTTWTQGTLAFVQTLADNIKEYAFNDLDLTAQPSGTAMRWKFTTHNSKEVQLHSAVIGWP